ncbi:hypothetical protein RB597_009421 [Gaeumannomyces tritici]
MVENWRWKWEHRDDDDDTITKQRQNAILRALRLRQNLRRGDWVPPLPRSHLGPDASAAEADSFLISGPWFIFRLELQEEYTKLHRIPKPDPRYWETIKWEHKQRWEQYEKYRCVVGEAPCHWKWRHESRSPEPEHLLPIVPMGLPPPSPAISYTSSENDELDTIDLSTTEQPDGYWTQKGSMGMVGQCQNPAEFSGAPSPTPPPRSPRTRLEQLGPMPPCDDGFGSLADWWKEKQEIDDALRAPQAGRAERVEQKPMLEDPEAMPHQKDLIEGLQRTDQRDKNGAGDCVGAPFAAPGRRLRLRPRDRSHRAAMTPPPDAPQPPAPRRSERIKSLKRQAVPLSSQDAPPNKRIRFVREVAEPPTVQTGTKTTRPKSGSSCTLPKKDEDAAETGRGRGRPKKETMANEFPSKEGEADATLKRGPKKSAGKKGVPANTTPKRGRGHPKKEPDIAKIPVPLPKIGKAAQAISGPSKRGRGHLKEPSTDKSTSVQQQPPDNRRGIRKGAPAVIKSASISPTPPAALPVPGRRRGRSQRQT